jgi:hypothetical protein
LHRDLVQLLQVVCRDRSKEPGSVKQRVMMLDMRTRMKRLVRLLVVSMGKETQITKLTI